MKTESALSSVVFPAPVPPEMMMFSRAFTAASSSIIMPGVSAPLLYQVGGHQLVRAEAADGKQRPVHGQRRDDRIHARAVAQPRIHHGVGLIDAPPHLRLTMRSMMRSRWASSWKRTLVSSSRPFRSTYTCRWPFTRMSEIVGSSSSGSSGPSPKTSSRTSSADLVLFRRRQQRRLALDDGQHRLRALRCGCGRRRCRPAHPG